jgi:NodT family efflux transporter outer membrane factor (OMF) lipoprotein
MKCCQSKNKLSIHAICLAVTVTIALTSCAVGPDYQAPRPQLSETFTRNSDFEKSFSTQKVVDSKWWENFQNKDLDHLIELALAHNPNIQMALSNLKVAQQNTIAQQGFFYPSITAGYSVTRQNGGATLSPSVNNVPINSAYNLHTAGLTVGFAPDIFGLNKRLVESLKAQEESQRLQLFALQTSIVSNLISSVAQVAALKDQVRINQEIVTINQKLLEHSKRLLDKGYVSGIDFANQQSTYASSIAQLSIVQKAHEQAIDLINILCGENTNVSLNIPNLEDITFPKNLPLTVPSNWINQRPDIKAAEEMVRASNAQIGVAIGNMLPQVSLNAVTGSSASAFSQLKDSVNQIWSSTLNFNQSIFSGGTLMARKNAAEAGLQASVDQYKSIVLNALQNVADSLYAIREDDNNLKSMMLSEEAMSKVLHLTQKQFDSGYASEPALLSAKSNYLQSKINRIQAQGIYLADTVSLYQSLGGGWSQN